jgi:hypothetical protein
LNEWTTPYTQNTPSTTNPEDEEIADALGTDGNASMPEQIIRPNPWRKIDEMMVKNIYDCPQVGLHQATKYSG